MSSLKSKTTDFTVGRIVPQLIVFSLPILLGQVFQTLYNSVDAIVVGRFVGTTALAAVSASGDLSHLLVGFFSGLSSGAGVLFSRYFGAKDHRRLHDSIHTAMLFSLVFGLIVAALGFVLAPWLLRLVDCPPDVYDEALCYLRIYAVGAVFTSVYNVGSGVLRAVGDSRDPLIFLIVSSLTNIALDLFFVLVIPMGVAGVAIATVISQILSVVLVGRVMLRTEDVYKLSPRDLRMDRRLLGEILSQGLPAGIQTCLISVSNLFVQRYINQLGSAAMAGMGAAKKMDRFVGIIANSVALGATSVISQNVGAGKMRRTFKAIRGSLWVCMVCIAALGIPTYYFAETVLSLFTDDPAALAYGVSMVHVMMPMYYLQMGHNIFGNALRGYGKSRAVMVLGLVGMVGIRQLFLQIAMSVNPCAEMVYIAYPVGWAAAAFLFLGYFLLTVVWPWYRSKAPAA